jgi:hypothetical protein
MKRSILVLLIPAILAIASLSTAQRAGVPAADPSAAFTVNGSVQAFVAAYGSGMPTLTVDDATLGSVSVALGPVWYLNDQGFGAAVGDTVELLAYPCATCRVGTVAAWVQNITSGSSITLRDESGYPVWRPSSGAGIGYGRSGPGFRGRSGAGGQGGCLGGPDMTQVATATGTVDAFSFTPGQGSPTLELSADQGQLTILVAPYRAVMGTGLVLEPGMEVTVAYAPVTVADAEHLVAISLTDTASGVTVQLRDPQSGVPLGWGRGHGYGGGHGRGNGGHGYGGGHGRRDGSCLSGT